MDVPASKLCKDCQLPKPFSDFARCRFAHGSYYGSYCKPCQSIRNRKYRATHTIKYRTVNVTCSDCGARWMMRRSNVKQWLGRCGRCALLRNSRSRPSNRFREVDCSVCGKKWKKRTDTLKAWKGLCKRCSSKEVAQRPEVKVAMRANGIAVMKRLGKLPQPPPEKRRRGAANNMWRGGITPINSQIRHSTRMKEWRAAVFQRDDFTCVICRQRGVRLNADHINPFSISPEQRFDVRNGRALCVLCHQHFGPKVFKGTIIREALSPLIVGANWAINTHGNGSSPNGSSWVITQSN